MAVEPAGHDPSLAWVKQVASRETVKTIRKLANELGVSNERARRLAQEAGIYHLLGDYSRDRVRGWK